MKTYTVSAFFPEVIAHKAYQNANAKATRIGKAVDRALSQIMLRDGIFRKRITVIKLTISIVEETEVA